MTPAPGALVERAFYYAGAGTACPFYLVGVSLPRRVRFNRMSDSEALDRLLGRLPHVSEREYERLVEASGRRWPASYQRECIPAWHITFLCAQLPRSGRRPRVTHAVATEWSMWDEAGRPSGGAKEGAAVLRCWTGRAPRGSQLAIVEEILGATREEVWGYYEAHKQPPARGSTPDRWQFWIEQHGGVDALLRQRFAEPLGDHSAP